MARAGLRSGRVATTVSWCSGVAPAGARVVSGIASAADDRGRGLGVGSLLARSLLAGGGLVALGLLRGRRPAVPDRPCCALPSAGAGRAARPSRGWPPPGPGRPAGSCRWWRLRWPPSRRGRRPRPASPASLPSSVPSSEPTKISTASGSSVRSGWSKGSSSSLGSTSTIGTSSALSVVARLVRWGHAVDQLLQRGRGSIAAPAGSPGPPGSGTASPPRGRAPAAGSRRRRGG